VRPSSVAFLFVAALGLSATDVRSIWTQPVDIPIGRIVANLESYTREHPADAHGHLTLARVHSLAFVNKADAISMFSVLEPHDGWRLPDISDSRLRYRARRVQEGIEFRAEDLVVHLSQSIRSFERAIELDPDGALSHLGLAYVLERGVAFTEEVDLAPPAAGLEESDATTKAARWRERTIEEYHRAYELALVRDSNLGHFPQDGLDSLISFEAAQAYFKLLAARGTRNDLEERRLAGVRRGLEDVEAKLRASGIAAISVTPIVFHLSKTGTLEDLLAPSAWVEFDLDGDNRPEPRPWVRPDTAILVWDPTHAGIITSGRQLFGSVTWWMFFTDGYRAMDALDDDRDGRLSGPELAGLAVWFDRNTNGVSEAGEVIAIEELPIASIATRATSIEDGSPANLSGLTLSDGRILPTYDWIVPPALFEPCAPPIDSITSR
jgi:hypothetical protein